MTYKFKISQKAEEDINDAYWWYESKKKGLGEYFLEALDLAEKAITNNPNSFQIRYKQKVRAYVVDQFPFLVLYIINGHDLDVISVFNTNQEPKKWKKRIK